MVVKVVLKVVCVVPLLVEQPSIVEQSRYYIFVIIVTQIQGVIFERIITPTHSLIHLSIHLLRVHQS